MSLITAGAGGANSSTVSNSKTILTSSRSPNHGNIKSYSPHSPKLSTKPDSLMQLSLPWLKTHIDHVAQDFRHDQRPDPRLDNNGRLSILLSYQYCGYRNLNANLKHKKALPLIVLRQLIKNHFSIENIAITQLCVGAFFFAMRSCEYLQTNIPE